LSDATSSKIAKHIDVAANVEISDLLLEEETASTIFNALQLLLFLFFARIASKNIRKKANSSFLEKHARAGALSRRLQLGKA